MGMDPFDEDMEKRQQAMSFGISMWKARIEGRKMMYEMQKQEKESSLQ
tara:strand:+ start:778 stop:921 length:144 start_codon:yes stop_codon:yes gene_type:complete